jgi:hypothetical protein
MPRACCLPALAADAELALEGAWALPKACPRCTPTELCAADTFGIFDADCTLPRSGLVFAAHACLTAVEGRGNRSKPVANRRNPTADRRNPIATVVGALGGKRQVDGRNDGWTGRHAGRWPAMHLPELAKEIYLPQEKLILALRQQRIETPPVASDKQRLQVSRHKHRTGCLAYPCLFVPRDCRWSAPRVEVVHLQRPVLSAKQVSLLWWAIRTWCIRGKPCDCRWPGTTTGGITYGIHGGSGALMSVGLLRQLPLDHMEACVKGSSPTATGARLTILLENGSYWSLCLRWQCPAGPPHHVSALE